MAGDGGADAATVINRTYPVLLDPDPEGGYTVTVPDLPGCISQGEDQKACLEHAQEAIAVYVAELLVSGLPVPEAKSRPGPPAAQGLILVKVSVRV